MNSIRNGPKLKSHRFKALTGTNIKDSVFEYKFENILIIIQNVKASLFSTKKFIIDWS